MLVFSKEAIEKSRALVETIETEVGWYGFVVKEGNDLVIKDICAPVGQTVSAALCTIQKEGDNELIDFEDECRELYGDGGLHAWFHSHVNMGTNPSTTDDSTFKELAKDKDYFIRIIMNKQNSIGITLAILGYSINITNYDLETKNEYTVWAEEKAKQIKEFSNKHRTVITYPHYARQSTIDDMHHKTKTDSITPGFSNRSYYDDYYDDDVFYKKKTAVKDQTKGETNILLSVDEAKKLAAIVPPTIFNVLGLTIEDLTVLGNVKKLLCAYPLAGNELNIILEGRHDANFRS